ncbi:MAG: trypsin-like peptidase domain-containing protein [Treponema sp.]|jgi:S1-C subfamily serine protease|nr:trypsin-like peptidase domain-containing protein [Treponema sp.]
MRLYSRKQVAFFSVLSGLIAVLFMMGAGLPSMLMGKKANLTEADADTGLMSLSAATPAATAETSPGPFSSGESWNFQAQTVQAAIPYTEDERENISIYERLNSAVVNITTETMAINWFLEPVPQEGSSGSGSIIDNRGYVLTNNHVIRNAHRVFINLADGSQFEGSVVGVDPENDIAVLKFDPPRGMVLRTVPYGDSSNLKVGQKVLAIGNPFALERTLTVGIVSGLGRPIQISRQHIVRDMIQTDASINPGNSGGPLLDTQGRMIGLNTMIYSPSGGSVGIGFAVPVNTARRVVNELMQYGKIRRGWIDATMVQLFPALVRHARLPVSSGLLVSRTIRGGLADKAGLRQGSEPVQSGRAVIYLGGDIITGVDNVRINTLSDLYSALENHKPGDRVRVEIIRGGSPSSLEITLADREEVMNQ